VQRIFVNAAIKKALCRGAGGDRSRLRKCDRGWSTITTSTSACTARPTAPNVGRSCQPTEAMPAARTSIIGSITGAGVPKPGKPLSSLPQACRAVLTAPDVHASNTAHHGLTTECGTNFRPSLPCHPIRAMENRIVGMERSYVCISTLIPSRYCGPRWITSGLACPPPGER
jgi:hypothetical protein